MIIQRNAIEQLQKWRQNPYRKPLVMQGARQVGKSWLLQYFGKTEFENYVVVNFDGEPELKDFFSKTKDIARIIEFLSLAKGIKIQPQTTLIIFDEIQECNDALNSLKYFCENAPEYVVVCAGSLLGVALNRTGSSFPVGKVEFINLYPLSFSEFLQASSPKLAHYLNSIDKIEPIPELFFSQLLDSYKTYHICGGMPEVVNRFIETHDIQAVETILQSILLAYQADFAKHINSASIPRVHAVWNNLHVQLAKDNKKFQYALIEKSARARDYEIAVNWLHLAGLVYKIYGTETVKLPVFAYKNTAVFKLYLLDIGLLRKLFMLDASTIIKGNSLFTEFKGVLSENFVLNSLIQQFGYEPVFWSSGNQAEIEFLLQEENAIIPVEVKSAASVKSRSLSEYRKTYSPSVSLRYSLKNLTFDDGLLNIPLFMADYSKLLLEIVKKNLQDIG